MTAARRRALVLVVAVVGVAGCGGGSDSGGGSSSSSGRYQYHLFLPAPAADVQGAGVVVDGQKRGTVSSVEAAAGSGTKADIGLDSPLRVTARTRVCKGELRIASGSTAIPLARSGWTFPLTQATRAPGGAGCG
jgi:hypothetical protein